MAKKRDSLPWESQFQQMRNSGAYIRKASSPLYHTARWNRLSRAWRMNHPLCAECLKNGIIKAAEVVDHIIPFPICKDFYDTKNLQSLCEKCNRAKGNKEMKMIKEYKRAHNIND